MKQEKINIFAQRSGWDYAEKIGEWNEYDVYSGKYLSKVRKTVGPTRFILAKGNEIKIHAPRFATEFVDSLKNRKET